MTDEEIGIVAGVGFIFFIAYIIVACLYIRSIQKTAEAIHEDDREMSPGLAWLLLIPVFNLIWLFLVVGWIKKGFEKSKASGRLSRASDGGYSIGIALAVMGVVSLLTSWIPFLGLIILIATVVLWIIHWNMVVNSRRDLVSVQR